MQVSANCVRLPHGRGTHLVHLNILQQPGMFLDKRHSLSQSSTYLNQRDHISLLACHDPPSRTGRQSSTSNHGPLGASLQCAIGILCACRLSTWARRQAGEKQKTHVKFLGPCYGDGSMLLVAYLEIIHATHQLRITRLEWTFSLEALN